MQITTSEKKRNLKGYFEGFGIEPPDNFQYLDSVVDKLIYVAKVWPKKAAIEVIKTSFIEPQKPLGEIALQAWKATLDDEKVLEFNREINYRVLDKEAEKKMLNRLSKGNLDKLVFEKHLDDHDTGKTGIYPFSGIVPLPYYVLEPQKKLYIDTLFTPENLGKKYASFKRRFDKNGITPVAHNLNFGLPKEAKDDLGEVVLKDWHTREYNRMHKEIKENINKKGLVVCCCNLPEEWRYKDIEGKLYNVLPNWIYAFQGESDGLGGYTSLTDYSLSDNTRRKTLKRIGKNVRSLGDLTNWQFFDIK